VASAKHNDMRLLSVILGSPTESARADDSERLLNYGFRFYETHQLYKAGSTITTLPLYKGQQNQLAIGLGEDEFITIPSGQYQRLSLHTKVPKYLQAPLAKGDPVGELVVQFDNQPIATKPLYALQSAPQGGVFTRMKDSIYLTFKGWFSA
jgi:D-alanyl-D-alanine carboxypeptidase (penicillin-binding protein 5/6)